MEYISAEKFLEQPKEIQESLLHWWKPNEFDIYKEVSTGYVYVVDKKQTDQETWERLKNTKTIIPLFTEGQLRSFIEEHYKGKVEIEYSLYGYAVYIIDTFSTDSDIDNVKEYFETNTIDLLEAYWNITCQIAVGNN